MNQERSVLIDPSAPAHLDDFTLCTVVFGQRSLAVSIHCNAQKWLPVPAPGWLEEGFRNAGNIENRTAKTQRMSKIALQPVIQTTTKRLPLCGENDVP